MIRSSNGPTNAPSNRPSYTTLHTPPVEYTFRMRSQRPIFLAPGSTEPPNAGARTIGLERGGRPRGRSRRVRVSPAPPRLQHRLERFQCLLLRSRILQSGRWLAVTDCPLERSGQPLLLSTANSLGPTLIHQRRSCLPDWRERYAATLCTLTPLRVLAVHSASASGFSGLSLNSP